MVEKDAPHSKELRFQQNAVETLVFHHGLRLESRPTTVAFHDPGVRTDLRCDDREIVRVVFHQIPCIGRQFVFQLIEETGRTEQTEVLVPAKAQPEQMVKTDEMIHVGVGHKDVIDFQEFSRRQEMQIADIEKNRLPAVLAFNVDAGVSERIVDQGRIVHRYTLSGISAHWICHGPFFSIRSRQTIPPVRNLTRGVSGDPATKQEASLSRKGRCPTIIRFRDGSSSGMIFVISS